MFTPNDENNTYWPQVFDVIREVSVDLRFDFVPSSLGVNDRFSRLDEVLQVLRSEPHPDAIIASVVIGHSRHILAAAEELGIPVFIQGPLFPRELADLGGGPRRKFKQWVALFSHAEEKKGYQLGHALLHAASEARATARDGSIHVVAVSGDRSWFGTGLREAGLRRALAEFPRAVLQQVVPTDWSPTEAERITKRLLERYPETSVVWAASDQLGQGAVAALTKAGRKPGKEVFTGGLDLSDVGLRMVREGEFVATVDSSMLSYAELAVYVYDYLQGKDFAPAIGSEIEFTPELATIDTVRRYEALSTCTRAIDFSAFSMAKNPELSRYGFSFAAYERAAGACLKRAR